jgi:drug/metabolite transporter (DMT)-like permease
MIFYAISLLAMGPLTTIDNTSPFWALIFGYFSLGESISKLEFISMIFAFSGIILVAFAQKEPTNLDLPESMDEDENPSYSNIIGVCLVVCTSMTLAAVGVLTR